MGGGAMLPPFTSTNSNNSFAAPATLRGPNFHSPPSLSSICETPFGESWIKNRCIDYVSKDDILDIDGVDEIGTKGKGSPHYDPIFGSVPSTWEVDKALSDLQSFVSEGYGPKEGMSWLEETLNPHQSTLLKSPGNTRFYDAYHMLQNEPSIQRLVCSIACDRAVWEAMMSNKAVRTLQGPLICAAKEEESQSPNGESHIGSLIVKWITGITTSRIVELVQSFGSLLSELINEIFEPANKEKTTSELSNLLEEKIRSSFLLSVILLLIVVVTRAQGV